MESSIMLSRAVVFLSLSSLAALPALGQTMYKCKDAHGKTYYTQLPPPECLGRETQELNRSGTIIRKDEPVRPLTPEQQAARAADLKKKQEADEKAKEERRKNLALLNTYASEKDIDNARENAVKEAEAAIKDTEKHIAGAQERRKELDKEKEFYLKKPMPLKLRQDISNVDIEIKNQNELLEAKKKEISIINAKYDEDKRRYVELTSSKAAK
jgi:hypothetical protein